MALIIPIKCLKTIIHNMNVSNIYIIIIFFNQIHVIYGKNPHDRNIFFFLNVIILLKVGCANLDTAPISSLFP